ncbi:RnaseH-domain-containing protein, partial [Suillus brevipes Sb2]
ITDSRYAINCLTKHLPTWEDTGWIGVANSEFIRATVYQLRKRSAQTSFEWIKGHDGQNGNEQADKLAKEGANKLTADELDLHIPDDFNLQGAKLSAITQALAYKGIREHIPFAPRRKTTSNLDVTRFAIQELTGQLETDASIWTGCRHKDLSKKIRQFLFKAMHGAHRIGEFWTNIPTYEHRARCTHCNADNESMEHILTDCPQNANSLIWSLARSTWPTKHGAWPRITLGTILGCGNINLTQPQPDNEQLHDKGASRLLRILISESAHLIWVLRCEKTIRGTECSPQTITKRWTSIINKRLQIDRLTARKINRTLTFQNLVTATWTDIITSTDPLPKNWAIALEVLVGIKQPRPSPNEAPR